MRGYTLAICENEEVQALYTQKILADYAQAKGLHFQLPLFESAEAFLFQYAEDKQVDILFLDIQMNEVDGIALAEKLRQEHDQIKIVFITGLTEHFRAGYRVEASDYLVKPIQKEQLHEVVDRVLNTIPTEADYLIVPLENEQRKIAVDEIVCAEINGRELTLTTTRESFPFQGTMQELVRQLDAEQFILTNRNWLVNLAHVERIGKSGIVMDNGMDVPVSRRNAKAVTDAFIQYFRKG